MVLILCSTALAEKVLERSEVLEIFATLTQVPQKSWIPAGTIQARHEEYRAAKTTDANEINRKRLKSPDNVLQFLFQRK